MDAEMEIEDIFDDWAEIEGIEELEISTDEESDSSENDESSEEDEGVLKCQKCKKVYHVLGWLKKHEEKCTGERKKQQKRKQELTQHQRKVRETLSNLGFDEYFENNAIREVTKALEEIVIVSDDEAKNRGERFLMCKLQALFLIKSIEENSIAVNEFLEGLAKSIWEICFAKDELLRTSTRQMYVAQCLHSLRISEELLSRWNNLVTTVEELNCDKLLLQKLITTIFANICEHRRLSLEMKETYPDESPNKPSLNDTEKSITSYISGYVCRKTKDRLQRYLLKNCSSKVPKVQEKSKEIGCMIEAINSVVPSANTHDQASNYLTFPDLLTLKITRGGLTQVNHTVFNFFCCLELCIRPFLNIARFRSSSRESDCKLIEQLLENSELLKSACPHFSSLSNEANDFLIKLFSDLYFRVRKWAYLKVYKEQKKVKENLGILKTSGSTVKQLHGKDSIRKALLNDSK